MVDAYPNYIEMVELNYSDIPLAGSNPVLTTTQQNAVKVNIGSAHPAPFNSVCSGLWW